jgi:hypothetical protein
MKKNKNPNAELMVHTERFKVTEDKAEIPVSDYTIHMVLAEAREMFRNSIRPIHPRTIYHVAQTILRNKRVATELPRRFEGENEFQAWLESQGLVESDDCGYVSQTGRKIFPSRD